MIRVQVVYEPLLYGDVLAQVLEQSGSIEVVTDPAIAVDVVIFRLDGDGQLQASWAPAPPPNAKLIAVAATGDQGWILLPGESEWSVIRPFGLDRLILEVLADCEPGANSGSTSFEVDEIPH